MSTKKFALSLASMPFILAAFSGSALAQNSEGTVDCEIVKAAPISSLPLSRASMLEGLTSFCTEKALTPVKPFFLVTGTYGSTAFEAWNSSATEWQLDIDSCLTAGQKIIDTCDSGLDDAKHGGILATSTTYYRIYNLAPAK